jgi:hypothetical protein
MARALSAGAAGCAPLRRPRPGRPPPRRPHRPQALGLPRSAAPHSRSRRLRCFDSPWRSPDCPAAEGPSPCCSVRSSDDTTIGFFFFLAYSISSLQRLESRSEPIGCGRQRDKTPQMLRESVSASQGRVRIYSISTKSWATGREGCSSVTEFKDSLVTAVTARLG